jgi:hypothetical protein
MSRTVGPALKHWFGRYGPQPPAPLLCPLSRPCRTVAFSSRRGLQMSGTALEIYLVGKKNGGIVGCFLSIVETANPSHQIGDIVSQ